MAHQVFLSHATEDADSASRVCEILEADGVGCWLGSRDARTRKDKAAANLQAIRTSDLVLLLFSSSANSSPTVLRDIERAISYERPVLSLHLDDALPNASLEYYLNLWQWLDASGGVEDKREDIRASVREQLAGTSGSATWRWLDAPDGVDTKREELLAAKRRAQRHGTDPAAGPGGSFWARLSWPWPSAWDWAWASPGQAIRVAGPDSSPQGRHPLRLGEWSTTPPVAG
jgi:hypothetical protein